MPPLRPPHTPSSFPGSSRPAPRSIPAAVVLFVARMSSRTSPTQWVYSARCLAPRYAAPMHDHAQNVELRRDSGVGLAFPEGRTSTLSRRPWRSQWVVPCRAVQHLLARCVRFRDKLEAEAPTRRNVPTLSGQRGLPSSISQQKASGRGFERV
ncbi:hypothetical protein NUW54_g12332 [Trametes sanguinea]|uniref:Uncharacterized protein n=1 Tax=Trametes sanguinea TaxID=158606 RepID=A0ACC1MZZ8_9APHY|nr:hypothetical protein NUW54_g12332 [Trametes sanguinea]